MEKTEFVLHNINYSEYGIESIEIGYDNHIETFAFFGNESNLNLKIGDTYEAYLKGIIMDFVPGPVEEPEDYFDVIDAEIVKIEEDIDNFIYLIVNSNKGPMVLSYNKKRPGALQLSPGLDIRVDIMQLIDFCDDYTEIF